MPINIHPPHLWKAQAQIPIVGNQNVSALKISLIQMQKLLNPKATNLNSSSDPP